MRGRGAPESVWRPHLPPLPWRGNARDEVKLGLQGGKQPVQRLLRSDPAAAESPAAILRLLMRHSCPRHTGAERCRIARRWAATCRPDTPSRWWGESKAAKPACSSGGPKGKGACRVVGTRLHWQIFHHALYSPLPLKCLSAFCTTIIPFSRCPIAICPTSRHELPARARRVFARCSQRSD